MHTRPKVGLALLVGFALGVGGYFAFANRIDPIQHRHDGFAHSWGLVFLLSALAGIAGLVTTLLISARVGAARARRSLPPVADATFRQPPRPA